MATTRRYRAGQDPGAERTYDDAPPTEVDGASVGLASEGSSDLELSGLEALLDLLHAAHVGEREIIEQPPAWLTGTNLGSLTERAECDHGVATALGGVWDARARCPRFRVGRPSRFIDQRGNSEGSLRRS